MGIPIETDKPAQGELPFGPTPGPARAERPDPVPLAPPVPLDRAARTTSAVDGASARASADGVDGVAVEVGASTSVVPVDSDGESSSGHAPARWIAVAGGLGYFPVAPGTAGAFAGVLLFVGLFAMGFATDPNPTWWRSSAFFGVYALLVGCLFMLGVWASGWAERDFGRKDDGRIVIDEVVGQLVTLAPILLLAGAFSNYRLLAAAVVTGFVLFRLFDIWKPGAVRWAERSFDGGLGVMADDLVAGVYGAVSLLALCGLAERLGWIVLDRGAI